MTKETEIVIIDGTVPAKCEICGKLEELRPYGPGGKFVCFDCAMKDEAEATRQFEKLIKGKTVVIKV